MSSPGCIPVFRPLIEPEEFTAVREALELGWLGMGSYVREFETALEHHVGDRRRVVAVSTGHAAIHLSLLLMGVGPGDEVITPAFNNIADFQAVLATGADLVFCDIDEKTLCIDLERCAELVTNRTKAIIVMDYDCVLCDHERVADFARRYGVRVLHDAAHAFGSKYRGEPIGSFSDIAVFSFDPVKAVTCIDGGAIVVKTSEEVEILHEMRLIGMGQPREIMYKNERAWKYDVRRLGFRYHLANLHAAVGLSQLKKLDEISTSRRETSQYYNLHLSRIPSVIVPRTDFEDITPFLYYIRVPERHREPLRQHMREKRIDTAIHWRPGHWYSLLRHCRHGDLSVTERVGREILSLPLHSKMHPGDQERVMQAVASYFDSPRP